MWHPAPSGLYVPPQAVRPRPGSCYSSCRDRPLLCSGSSRFCHSFSSKPWQVSVLSPSFEALFSSASPLLRSDSLWWEVEATGCRVPHSESQSPFLKLIYLAVWGLSFGTQGLRSSLWHVGSSSLTRDRTQVPLLWDCGVLAAGPPGKSPESQGCPLLPGR